MEEKTQPAIKKYLFEKAYRDIYLTSSQAFNNNINSIKKYFSNISDAGGSSIPIYLAILVLNIFLMLSVGIFGSILLVVTSLVHLLIVLVCSIFYYTFFLIIWSIDKLYRKGKNIFVSCHECKERSLLPTYLCPSCGAGHSDLTPGIYGVLKRTCTGPSYMGEENTCGQKIPTTFFNGRKKLDAICTNCHHPLTDKETVPICIPVVGGRSVGKTAFITAFANDFMEDIAPANGWETEIYNKEKEEIYEEISRDYSIGSTRMTERSNNIDIASSVSFSFYIKSKKFKPDRLAHIYDIAGEVFTDSSENEIQKQYEYSHGIVLMVDPFSIPSLRYRFEPQLNPEDVAGIGNTDIGVVVDSFLNKLREVTGISSKKMLTVPLAVVISKVDSANLLDYLGEEPINKLMEEEPEKFKNYQDAEDYLCRKLLLENNMASFLNSIDLKFKNNRFFASSAIGHTRDKGKYEPIGVMEPMEWLFRQAGSKISKTWKDTEFSKKIISIEE